MALSGNSLPQVSSGGSLSGTLHIVTSDGAGPYKAMINTDGTGESWTPIDVVTQVPGKNGNIRKGQDADEEESPTSKRWWARALRSSSSGASIARRAIAKRATNINEDFPFKVAIPAGTQCTGSAAGQSNMCIVKLVNPSGAGPFGGCVPVQMVGANGTAAAAAPAAGDAAGDATGASTGDATGASTTGAATGDATGDATGNDAGDDAGDDEDDADDKKAKAFQA